MSQELTSGRAVSIDADLDLLFDQVKQLLELACDPDKAHDSARVYDFSIRWGTFLRGRLERLAYYHNRAALSADEQARYQALRTELRRALPLVEQLGLARPNVALDDSSRR
ncbi:MAG: hypothetical protein JO100_02890 [Pseudonocardia sp.]|nr:hypothetical protein [Pseudonocardia sp.]